MYTYYIRVIGFGSYWTVLLLANGYLQALIVQLDR